MKCIHDTKRCNFCNMSYIRLRLLKTWIMDYNSAVFFKRLKYISRCEPPPPPLMNAHKLLQTRRIHLQLSSAVRHCESLQCSISNQLYDKWRIHADERSAAHQRVQRCHFYYVLGDAFDGVVHTSACRQQSGRN